MNSFINQRLKFLLNRASADQRPAGAYSKTHCHLNRMETFIDKHSEELLSLNRQLMQEIRERQKMEQALRESERQYRLIFENAGEAIIIAQDERVLFVNPAATAMSGYSSDHLLKTPFTEMIRPVDRSMILTRRAQRRAGEQVPCDYVFQVTCADNSVKWAEVNTVPIEWDGQPATLNYIRDVTARRKIEDALRESERQYRLLFENAGEAVIIVQDERVLFSNPAAAEMTGYRRENLLKTPFTEMVHPSDREMVLTRYMRRIAGEQVPNLYVFRIICADNTVKWFEINSMGIEWQGKPATLNFLRDISLRIKIEDVAGQVRKMETVGTLAAGIAHQFNNTLTGISGSIDLMMLNMPDNPKMKKYAGTILRAVNTMADLNRQLLAYARGGKYQPRRQSLQPLIKDVIRTTPPAGDKQIEIKDVFSPDTPTIEADTVQLKMVVQAVLNNAFEAIGKKGTIRISTSAIRVTRLESQVFPGLPEGFYTCLCIADDGIGMSEDTAQHIFEPFFTTKFMGRGMGMAAAYGIIKNHGGNIYVDSEPGHGTLVTIFLPTYLPDLARHYMALVS